MVPALVRRNKTSAERYSNLVVIVLVVQVLPHQSHDGAQF